MSQELQRIIHRLRIREGMVNTWDEADRLFFRQTADTLEALIAKPEGFAWTDEMYQAFDMLPKKPRPFFDVLLALHEALNGAALGPREKKDA